MSQPEPCVWKTNGFWRVTSAFKDVLSSSPVLLQLGMHLLELVKYQLKSLRSSSSATSFAQVAFYDVTEHRR
jgi:hypothetical protein